MLPSQRVLYRSVRSISLLGLSASLCLTPQARAAEKGLEEVIVTARKREENLQQVPAAVNVFTAESLKDQQIDSIVDLQKSTPNVTMMETGGLLSGNLTVFIRGIGNDPGFDPGVGIYLDDVYLSRTNGLMMQLYDIQRVEILKGPQGNLYGRNTIGGAIKYITREPDDSLSGNLEGKIGTGNLRQVKGNVSGPLVDGLLYGGVGIAYQKRDGFQTNIVDGHRYDSIDSVAWRANLKLTPSDSFTAKLMYNYSYDNPEPKVPERLAVDRAAIINQFNKGIPPALPGTADLSGALGPGKANTTFDFSMYYLKTRTAALTLEWQPSDALTLKSVSAYRAQYTRQPYDFGATADAYLQQDSGGHSRDLSQEFQLNYTGRHFEFVSGIFYLNGYNTSQAVTFYTPRYPIPSAGALDYMGFGRAENHLKSASVYANLDYDLTERLHASLGIRDTFDRKQVENEVTRVGRLYIAPGLACTYGVYTGACAAPQLRRTLSPQVFVEPTHQGWHNYSPTFKLAYDLTPDTMVYAGVASGFKAGGLNISGAQVQDYNPEEVRAYTLGYKTTLADNRLRINMELFYNDYTDKQFSYVTFDKNNSLTNMQGNVGKMHTQGVDFESTWLTPIDGLQLDLNVGYLEVHLQKFDVPNFATGAVNDISDSTALGYSPRWTVSPRVSYTMAAGTAGDLTFSADANYRARQYTNTPIDLNDSLSVQQRSSDYTIFNASVVFRSADRHWRYALEGRNLTDRRVINSTYSVAPFINAGYNDPFTWALSVGYSY